MRHLWGFLGFWWGYRREAWEYSDPAIEWIVPPYPLKPIAHDEGGSMFFEVGDILVLPTEREPST